MNTGYIVSAVNHTLVYADVHVLHSNIPSFSASSTNLVWLSSILPKTMIRCHDYYFFTFGFCGATIEWPILESLQISITTGYGTIYTVG